MDAARAPCRPPGARSNTQTFRAHASLPLSTTPLACTCDGDSSWRTRAATNCSPSITISLPTVNALTSDARKTTARAISSGYPRCFNGEHPSAGRLSRGRGHPSRVMLARRSRRYFLIAAIFSISHIRLRSGSAGVVSVPVEARGVMPNRSAWTGPSRIRSPGGRVCAGERAFAPAARWLISALLADQPLAERRAAR